MSGQKFSINKMSPVLLVADMEASSAFYTERLGFRVDFRYEDFYAGISLEGCSIHLKKRWSRPPDRGRDQEDPTILFSVSGIESIYAQVAANAVQVTQTLREMPYGKEFYIADPDGYVLAFVEEI